MNAGNSTGNPARLSLPERAKRGLLLSERALFVEDIALLEHPADPVARKALVAAIHAAIQFGDLPDDDFEVRHSGPIGMMVPGL